MTWWMFLQLRQWAQGVADEIGYPAYLVGSVLYKKVPRDIDVSVIVPLADYERLYGKLPETQEDYSKYLLGVHNNTPNIAKYFFDGEDALGGKVTFDFKICSDNWFTENPKVLLAEPRKAGDTY